MKQYTCSICQSSFKRYKSQVSNNSPTCSKTCQAKKYTSTLIGENNPNYKNGAYCEESICECGKQKDYRAKKCSICSKSSYPKDKSSLISDERIIEEIKKSNSFLDVSKKLPVSRKRVSDLVKEKDIDISHFRHCNFRPYTKEKLFCINNKRINSTVKKFILNNNLIEYKCNECGQGDIWNNKLLILELDHKNGNPNDNRLDNLRFLCSNCHSQTITYTGRNAKRTKSRERRFPQN